MRSIFWDKIKESAVSVLPVMAIVIVLDLTVAPLAPGLLSRYLVGGLLLILGLSIFLIGADIGMVPFGQRVGSALTQRRSLGLILAASFVIGFAITIAEPDVQVLASQVIGVAPDLNRTALLLMIAVGVGLFLVVAMLRVVLRVSLRLLLLIFYALVFIVCAFIDPGFVGVAFDSGGATTGPITVPFIMAMGIGVASAIKQKEDDDASFGFVGLASIGPIAAVAVMGFLSDIDLAASGRAAAPDASEYTLVGRFLHEVPHVTQDIFLALAPLVLILIVFQLTLLRLPGEQVKRMILGMVYAFIGLVVFMVGVNGGFTPAGRELGRALTAGHPWLLMPVGLVLGAVVVCAEPAVWVLTEQVEEVSGGYIKRRIMLAALCVSIAVAVMLGMVRVIYGMSIWWMLIPGYVLALALTRWCPPLFTAIAFDSGGVASGPMSTTFVLALTLGASMELGGNPATDAFGMVAMIAMAPLITIQLVGLAFEVMERRQQARAGEGKSL